MPTARPSQAAALRSETRRLILDAVERGCRVKVAADGTIHIDPPAPAAEVTTADLIDWKRRP